MNRKPVTRSIEVADQPTAEELAALPGEGFVGVVNLRHPGEPDQPLDPEAEGRLCRSVGLDYLHVGVGRAPMTEAEVGAVGRFLADHAGTGKVLVHCKLGARAAAVVLIDRAVAEGWTAAEALARGPGLGLEIPPNLRPLIVGYLDGRDPGP